ncbi:MAG: HEPN domain-containing protein [Chromatiales bacterium]|nr:HEPN domain-containing protein [Chromatiales bacterium]
MKAARTEAGRWLRQAESDLAFAELGAREGFPAQACFTSQQAAEKALKAIHYLSGERFVPGHSLVELLETAAQPTGTLARLLDSARQLDQYYIPTRYPNGIPGGIPAEVFTDSQAEDAVIRARAFIEVARAAISGC